MALRDALSSVWAVTEDGVVVKLDLPDALNTTTARPRIIAVYEHDFYATSHADRITDARKTLNDLLGIRSEDPEPDAGA